MENTTKKQSSTASKVFKFGCLPVIVLVIIFVLIGIFILDPESEKIENEQTIEKVEPKKWDEMTYNEREKWIDSYINKPDDLGYQLVAMTNKAIKNKFKYPEEVDFDNWGGAILSNGTIVEADSGWVFCVVKGTAKNAFGVKSRFTAQVKWKITQPEIQLLKIDVRDGN